jgi:hypothetical protein
MGKDYRNSYNQDKKFRGKKPDKFKKGQPVKKSGRDQEEPSIDFDLTESKFDGRRY